VTFPDKVRKCKIRKSLNVEPLLRIEWSQLGWFGHVIKTPSKFGETIYAGYNHEKAVQRSTRWHDYLNYLGPAELLEIAENPEVFLVLARPLPLNSLQRKSGCENE